MSIKLVIAFYFHAIKALFQGKPESIIENILEPIFDDFDGILLCCNGELLIYGMVLIIDAGSNSNEP